MKKVLKYILVILLIVAVAAVGFGVYYSVTVTEGYEFEEELLATTQSASIVYDIDNTPMTTNTATIDSLDEAGSTLINAFVATEDKRFFNHHGIDLIRIAAAINTNIKEKSFSEGGSTISQQLIKNTHLSNEKTIKRKLIEIKLALEMEKELSKEQILLAYFNNLYFGQSIIGIKAASSIFFDKECNELTVRECAMLAATVKSPLYYSPALEYDNCINRSLIVLDLMYENELLSEEQLVEAQAETPAVVERESNYQPYYNCVLAQASKVLGISAEEVTSGNYNIYTYMDSTQQSRAAALYASELTLQSDGRNADINILLADNSSCGITAYYTNTDNNAYTLRRQSGSTLKPLAVYAPAIDYDLVDENTKVNDTPEDYDGWKPHNYKHEYHGWVTIAQAIRESMNVPAVTVLETLGVDVAKQYLSAMNIDTADEDELTIALGGTTYGQSIYEMCGGYMTLANNGVYNELSFIKEIRDENGLLLYKNTMDGAQVFTKKTSQTITKILRETARYGTAKKLGTLRGNVAAKTGTVNYGDTEKNSDSWCIGYTDSTTFAVWLGAINCDETTALDASCSGGNNATLCARRMLEDD